MQASRTPQKILGSGRKCGGSEQLLVFKLKGEV